MRDLTNRGLPSDPALLPIGQRAPEARPPDGAADEAWHAEAATAKHASNETTHVGRSGSAADEAGRLEQAAPGSNGNAGANRINAVESASEEPAFPADRRIAAARFAAGETGGQLGFGSQAAALAAALAEAQRKIRPTRRWSSRGWGYSRAPLLWVWTRMRQQR